MRRDTLLQAVVQGRAVEGFWKETVFPTLERIAKYGADMLTSTITPK